MIFLFAFTVLCWVGLMYWVHRRLRDHSGPSLINAEVVGDVTVLIAFRNEAETLGECLSALNKSEGIADSIHVLLVNDHSNDGSLEVIEESKSHCHQLNIEVVQNAGQGKKEALQTGISGLEEGWIYLTDADCQVGPKTIRSLITRAESEEVQVIFGPVLYQDRTLRERLLAYENLNTQAISEAFVRAGRPIMVNGGNLLMHAELKQLFMESMQMDRASGDDVFFAQQLNKDHLSGCYTLEASVLTSPPANMRSLARQRIRWASKYPGYKQLMSRVLPAFVFALNLVFLWMGLVWLTSATLLNVLLPLFVVKWLAEFAFHRTWFLKYSFRARLIDSLLLSMLFPGYYVTVGVVALVAPRFEWKGRPYDR